MGPMLHSLRYKVQMQYGIANSFICEKFLSLYFVVQSCEQLFFDPFLGAFTMPTLLADDVTEKKLNALSMQGIDDEDEDEEDEDFDLEEEFNDEDFAYDEEEVVEEFYEEDFDDLDEDEEDEDDF